jgi:predicted nucleic-acid-binding Zn-ribbon protein
VNVNASSVEAREIQIAGKQLRCQVCEYPRFYRREAGLSTGASNVFGQDWANSQASCFICEQCGYVHWFVRARAAAMAAEDSELAQEIEALRVRLEAEEEMSAETLESTRS